MNISIFTQARWREWLEHTGYGENDAPYLWCLDALGRFPDSKDARSIRNFLEIWEIGRRAGEKEASRHPSRKD